MTVKQNKQFEPTNSPQASYLQPFAH